MHLIFGILCLDTIAYLHIYLCRAVYHQFKMSDIISNGRGRPKGCNVMVTTVISNDGGAELRGSRSAKNTLDSVSWSNKPWLETPGPAQPGVDCLASLVSGRLVVTQVRSGDPGPHLAPVWERHESPAPPSAHRAPGLCLLGMSSLLTSLFNHGAMNRMQGTIQWRHVVYMDL